MIMLRKIKCWGTLWLFTCNFKRCFNCLTVGAEQRFFMKSGLTDAASAPGNYFQATSAKLVFLCVSNSALAMRWLYGHFMFPVRCFGHLFNNSSGPSVVKGGSRGWLQARLLASLRCCTRLCPRAAAMCRLPHRERLQVREVNHVFAQ